MAFNFDKLFPEAAKKKSEEKQNLLLYIILVEWKWDYETFLNTPIPVIFRVLDRYNNIKKQEEKAYKK